MKSKDIRLKFLEFFKSKSHVIVPSAPMVIKDDPTLMFTNAGMNQFKEYFLGNTVPKYSRITDTQKCLRVSGKHNDLEEVGMDTYHHTMFEMLGNWSFGNPEGQSPEGAGGYFKKEAIRWAWELLTEVYKIDPDMLYVSVFEGSEEEGVEMDSESFELWKGIVPEDKIILGNKKDNFWEMGDQGPCGPSSEIHVDIRSEEEKAKTPGRELVNQDHPQVVEIWNLVFIEFNRKADGSLEKLPAKHVDTGMGFERLCMVLQGKKSNYDTDVFSPLIERIEDITGTSYKRDEKTAIAIRVIADHVRAVTFAIADGQTPGNTGAGYVIRRILRRAIRYGFTFLDMKEAFIYKLVKTLSDQMGEAFPELKAQKELCENVIREEEQSFLRTLDQGLLLLEKIIEETEGKTVSGKKAFELYDTFGFPIDLTALILRERGYSLDEEEFGRQLQMQKERSRAASAVTTEDWQIISGAGGKEFIGYDALEADVYITRYRKVETKKEGELYQLVFNKTPFYPEGGGQVGDTGYLRAAGEEIEVINTKKENNLILHFTKKLPGEPQGVLKAEVDARRREKIQANHSATHLLHQALRKVLGDHVEQKGSMVGEGYLRFDFSHFSKLSHEELKEVEAFVNARISENIPLVEEREIAFSDAVEQGAIALFGEKYGDTVRMVRFGDSRELCGGTHVPDTAAIWYFKISGESAVAAGIRRIEAITGEAAKAHFEAQSETLEHIQAELKNTNEPIRAIRAVLEENLALRKQVENLLREKAGNLKSELGKEITTVNGVEFLAKKIDLDAAGIKDLAFQLGSGSDKLFLLLATEQDGKALLSCYISKELVAEKGLNAGKVVKELGKYIQGGGGGQPFFATAGGKNPQGIEEALQNARSYIE